MTDIVTRLRDPKMTIHGRAGMVAEAADEIERLRKILCTYTDHLDIEWAQSEDPQ